MNNPTSLRKGWCPGALRPMETGDGLLVRIKPRQGKLTISELRVLADVACHHGSGQIDLTNRANIQLRGLTPQTYNKAIEELTNAGLIDRDIAVENVRNIIVDPLADLDTTCFDIRPLAAELEQQLENLSELQNLPPKFGFEFSENRVHDGQHHSDILIAANQNGSVSIQLDGDTKIAGDVTQALAMQSVVQLASLFLSLSEKDTTLRRMRDAVAAIGAPEIFQRARLSYYQLSDQQPSTRQSLIGTLGQKSDPVAAGIGFPFGRIDAVQLSGLCDAAKQVGVTETRISKHRSFVFPGRGEKLIELLDYAKRAGLIVDMDDARIDTDVCPGAPACRNATTETHKDAEKLVYDLQSHGISHVSLHVSGCQKGCARAGKADFTLIANNGAYDIVSGGTVGDDAFAKNISPQSISSVIRDQLLGTVS